MRYAITATAALISLAGAAHAEDAAIQAIVPEGMEFIIEQYRYSPAVRAGDYVYLAGVVATLAKNDAGNVVEANRENLQTAYKTAFLNIA